MLPTIVFILRSVRFPLPSVVWTVLSSPATLLSVIPSLQSVSPTLQTVPITVRSVPAMLPNVRTTLRSVPATLPSVSLTLRSGKPHNCSVLQLPGKSAGKRGFEHGFERVPVRYAGLPDGQRGLHGSFYSPDLRKSVLIRVIGVQIFFDTPIGRSSARCLAGAVTGFWPPRFPEESSSLRRKRRLCNFG